MSLACVHRSRRCVLTLLLLMLLVACAGTSPHTSYYSLTSMSPANLSVHNMVRHPVALGVGPVTVADYLKRTQIVTRLAPNQFHFSEFNRWAGMLEADIATVLGNNLGLLLGTDQVASYPWIHFFEPDYRIVVEITRFDAALHGEAVLNARWSISDRAGEKMLASGKSEYREPLDKPDFAALVEAESRLLAKLSREIFAPLQKLIQ